MSNALQSAAEGRRRVVAIEMSGVEIEVIDAAEHAGQVAYKLVQLGEGTCVAVEADAIEALLKKHGRYSQVLCMQNGATPRFLIFPCDKKFDAYTHKKLGLERWRRAAMQLFTDIPRLDVTSPDLPSYVDSMSSSFATLGAYFVRRLKTDQPEADNAATCCGFGISVAGLAMMEARRFCVGAVENGGWDPEHYSTMVQFVLTATQQSVLIAAYGDVSDDIRHVRSRALFDVGAALAVHSPLKPKA
jgi:hypothetical protein